LASRMSRYRKLIRMSALSAPAKIFQRISPLLVTVEITDKPCRLLLTRKIVAIGRRLSKG